LLEAEQLTVLVDISDVTKCKEMEYVQVYFWARERSDAMQSANESYAKGDDPSIQAWRSNIEGDSSRTWDWLPEL
jgi:hypothetical protein